MNANRPFRPMLAEDTGVERVHDLIARDGFVYASYKLDGIRALTMRGGLFSRSMKLIPNRYVQNILGNLNYEGLDGELICDDACGQGVFARASSAFMSFDGKPDWSYWVFDMPAEDGTFNERYAELEKFVDHLHSLDHMYLDAKRIKLVKQYRIGKVEELLEIEAGALQLGFEGLIIKSPKSPYKQGRSTLREGWMLKLKRFRDSEAKIIGFEELYHNQNEAKLDERGFTRRSSQNAGKVPAGMLGALQVRDIEAGWEFNIGSGFDHDLRKRIWEARDQYRGKIVKYKYLPIGMKDVPRHPIFLGFRDPIDMG